MKKMSKTSILAISIALIGLVWIFAIVAYTVAFELPWLCWGSITCTVIAIIVAELYLLVFKKHPGEQAAESGALGAILTICYLMITTLLNSVFVLLRCGNFNWFLLAFNMAAVVGYIILLLCVEQHTARLAVQLVKTEEKTVPTKDIARKLGELLAITEDAEIRSKLLKLKEAVDYGNNISTNATAEKEQQMNELLDELLLLTIGKANKIIVLNKVDAAEMTWKLRSSKASSDR